MDFHDKLIEACGNPLLLDICARLSDAADVYRAWSGPGSREVHRDIAGEHKNLLDAALAHDADRAVLLFEAHHFRRGRRGPAGRHVPRCSQQGPGDGTSVEIWDYDGGVTRPVARSSA